MYVVSKEDKYPERNVALLMTAGDDREATFDHAVQFYHVFAEALGWKDLGTCLAGGCIGGEGERRIDERHLKEAYELEEKNWIWLWKGYGRKEMRAYLKESVEQRLEDEQKRKDLISGISHDLRTPLTSIRGYVEGLLDGIADTPRKERKIFCLSGQGLSILPQQTDVTAVRWR